MKYGPIIERNNKKSFKDYYYLCSNDVSNLLHNLHTIHLNDCMSRCILRNSEKCNLFHNVQLCKLWSIKIYIGLKYAVWKWHNYKHSMRKLYVWILLWVSYNYYNIRPYTRPDIHQDTLQWHGHMIRCFYNDHCNVLGSHVQNNQVYILYPNWYN